MEWGSKELEWNCFAIPGLSSTQHLLNNSTMWRWYAEQDHIECRCSLGVGEAKKVFAQCRGLQKCSLPLEPAFMTRTRRSRDQQTRSALHVKQSNGPGHTAQKPKSCQRFKFHSSLSTTLSTLINSASSSSLASGWSILASCVRNQCSPRFF